MFSVIKTETLDLSLYEIVIILFIALRKLIGNGNRTERSPIRSLIIRVINKIG